MKVFNINNYVKFRLTEQGQAYFDKYLQALKIEIPKIAHLIDEKNQPDNDGFYRGQLWQVMEVFGDACYNGSQIFEDSLFYFDDKDFKPKTAYQKPPRDLKPADLRDGQINP